MTDQMITLQHDTTSFPAYVAMPENAKGGIIVIHEVWGLNEHTKDVARRLAREGYVALAPDLLAGTAIDGKLDPELIQRAQDPATRDEAQKELRAKLAPLQSPAFSETAVTKLQRCVDWLIADPQTQGRVAVTGFCFGGTYTYALAVADPRLKAAAAFYGHADQSVAELRHLTCPVIAFYGEQDTGLTDKLPQLEANMREAGIDFHATIYPETGHAFFNDTNPNRYNEAAATDSWKQLLAFLEKNIT